MLLSNNKSLSNNITLLVLKLMLLTLVSFSYKTKSIYSYLYSLDISPNWINGIYDV